MVKSLAEHSNLNDAIDSASAQILEHFLNLVRRHVAVDFTRVQASFRIERTDLAGVVHRTGYGDQLMEGSRLPKVLKPLDAGIHYGSVAFRGQGNTSAEPFLVPQLKDLFKRMSPGISSIGEGVLLWRDIYGRDLFDVASHHGGPERICINPLARDLASVASERRGGQADDLGVGEPLENPFPTSGNVVMPLVHQDQVEEIIREGRKPAVSPAGQLLDVGNHDMRILAVVDVRVLAVQDGREGAMTHVGQNARRSPETFTSGDIEGSGNAPTNLKVRSNHQDTTLGGLKRQQSHEARLSAAHRNLKDGVLGTVPEMLACAKPSLNLGIAQVRIALDEGPCCIEESGYFLVSHLFVNLPAGLHLTLVMKSPYSPAT